MMRHRCVFLHALTVLIAFAPQAFGQGLPKTSPKSVGLSQDRLDRITAVMQKHVDEDLLAGAVALVARNGKVAYLQCVGMQDREKQVTMNPETIFRIASMSKAITSVAVMMLYEEGKFCLSDPVSKFIPEFADAKVLAPDEPSAKDGVVAAKRPITIRHLLTHTSGLTYHWDDKVGKLYVEAGITHGLIEDEDSLADDMKKLACIPLVHHPGDAFTYSLSTDVLGRVVEVASGMPFEEFLEKRIFAPLKMNDTGFRLSKSQASRLAAVYAPDATNGLKRLPDGVLSEGNMKTSVTYPYAGTHNYRSGGGGLCSTAPDYARFLQMMLNKGELDGVRLLSRKTVEMMTTDQVGDLKRDMGFGLGFGITRDLRKGELTSVGAYRWGGYWFTTFFVDPAEQMIGVCMAQINPSGKATLHTQFEALAHQAIVD